MLVHICCSVDSHYFLKQLQNDFPDENIEAFFYDPNIHPYSEYRLRYEDVKYSCAKLGIKLYEGEYDLNSWLGAIKGYENEPEKGARCNLCFEHRLEITVQKAIKLGHLSFTTTLLISPLKSQEKLKIEASKLEEKYNIKWIFRDYRSGNGLELQAKEVKEHNLYRQNYCGCMFALTQQRLSQEIFTSELISPITKQILPNSIEERLELYHTRNRLEEENKPYKIYKKAFQNYRLLSGSVKIQKKIVPSYILFYSRLKPKIAKVKIEFVLNKIDEIYYMNKNEIRLMSIKTLNNKLNSDYKDICQMMQNPPNIDDEIAIRDSFDYSPIIILDEENIIENTKYEIKIDSILYEDSRTIITQNYENI
jgi:predicted adenine nucleotide alpha hydrolase (AANH) superfamily ATPase